MLIERLNRFTLKVRVGRDIVKAYLANPGRLTTVLAPQRKVLLMEVDAIGRRTRYNVFAVKAAGNYVTVSSAFANRIFEEALRRSLLQGFEGYVLKRREAYLKNQCRIDFLLRSVNGKDAYVEVKSCTEVVNGVALFPDAPSERGRRHVASLRRVLLEGLEAYVVFIVQRPDAKAFRPYYEVDPKFSEELVEAAREGVNVKAYKTMFQPPYIYLDPRPLKLEGL
ncbi:MAG: DNA/RNA nuclease SfsA [Candidatus Nezhaarchaeales archaeon]